MHRVEYRIFRSPIRSPSARPGPRTSLPSSSSSSSRAREGQRRQGRREGRRGQQWQRRRRRRRQLKLLKFPIPISLRSLARSIHTFSYLPSFVPRSLGAFIRFPLDLTVFLGIDALRRASEDTATASPSLSPSDLFRGALAVRVRPSPRLPLSFRTVRPSSAKFAILSPFLSLFLASLSGLGGLIQHGEMERRRRET